MLKPIQNWWENNSLLLAISFTILILMASLVNPKQVLISSLNVSDKLLHFLSYTILMLSWMMVLKSIKKLEFQVYLLIILLLFGIIIELLQGTITHYRVPDLKDVLANFLGLIIGWMIFRLLKN